MRRALVLLISACSIGAQEPDYVRFAVLAGNPQIGPDVVCVRIGGGGVPAASQRLELLGFQSGPNGIPEAGGGDDVALGPVLAAYSFRLLHHHARYTVDDPAQVGAVDSQTGTFTGGPGPATGFGEVEAVGPGGTRASVPVFILPPDFVADPPPRPHHLACEDRGARVELSWIPGGEYLHQTVWRDGDLLATLPPDARRHDDLSAAPGIHEYEVLGTAFDAGRGRELDSEPTRCVAVVRRPRTVQLLWSPAEQLRGPTDSAAAVREALLANGEEVFQVEEIVGVNLRDFRAVWAIFGTYPDEHYLWLSEAVQLAEYLTRDRGKLYIEGADIWGFVPPNAFHQVDGVFDCPPADPACIGIDGGRNDLGRLRGADGGNGLDLSEFAGPVAYTGENMFIDRLVPGPPGAAAVWWNADVEYAVGIAHRGAASRTIQCSFEFGGIQADRVEILRRYLEFLGASSAELRFRRGDADGTGEVDITDAIAVLGFLFLGGPLRGCADSGDANDDGTLDITDAIHILAFLFLGGPPPAQPSPDCGVDPTGDPSPCLDRPTGCL